MALAEGKLRSWGRAQRVVRLLDDGNIRATVAEITNAVESEMNMTRVKSLLQQECSICFDICPPHEVRHVYLIYSYFSDNTKSYV